MSNRTDSSSPPATPPRGILAWLRAWWSRLIAGLAFAVVAGVTGRISYVHIQALSLALYEPPSVARIMPFGIDGLIVVGSVALLQAAADQWWLGWVCVVPGAAASLFANIESEIRHGWMAAGWAGVASVSFIAATFTLERWAKAQFSRDTQPPPGGAPQPGAEAASAGPCDGDPAVPGPLAPLTTMEALRQLLETESDRNLAFALRVDRNRVRAWRTQLDAAGGETAGPDAGEAPVAAMNGSAASG